MPTDDDTTDMAPCAQLDCGGDGHGTSELRVWPGGGGLELFRLQLRGLLDAWVDPDAVNFVIEAPGQGGPLHLPGLASYGVASYCAAIGAALGTGAVSAANSAAAAGWGHGQSTADEDTSDTAAYYDDWIDLLCSVADILDGEQQPPQKQQQPEEVRGAALLTVWVRTGGMPSGAAQQHRPPVTMPMSYRALSSSLMRPQGQPLLHEAGGVEGDGGAAASEHTLKSAAPRPISLLCEVGSFTSGGNSPKARDTCGQR